MDNESRPGKTGLRIVAGILALAALVVTVVRVLAMDNSDVTQSSVPLINFLRIVFPLSVALLFGYVAWKGKFPFLQDSESGKQNGGDRP